MLFDPPMDEYTDADRLIQHIRERLKLLWREDLDEKVTRFEATIENGRNLDDCWDSIYVDGQCALQSKQKLLRFLQETALMALNFKNEKTPKPETQIAIIDSGCLLSRQCFRIRVDVVGITVSEDVATVAYAGVPLFKAKTYLSVPHGSYEGRLALYFIPRYMIPALVCISKNLVVCAYIPIDSTEKIDDSTRKGLVGAMAQALMASDLRQTFHSMAYLDSFEQIDLGEYQKFVPKIVPAITNMYLNHALRFVANDKLDSCLASMQAHGFWNLLSESNDLPAKKAERVRALATMGLVTSYDRDWNRVGEIVKSKGYLFDEIVSDFQRSYHANGYRTIAKSDDLKYISCFV
jgi:hypothetical protein